MTVRSFPTRHLRFWTRSGSRHHNSYSAKFPRRRHWFRGRHILLFHLRSSSSPAHSSYSSLNSRRRRRLWSTPIHRNARLRPHLQACCQARHRHWSRPLRARTRPHRFRPPNQSSGHRHRSLTRPDSSRTPYTSTLRHPPLQSYQSSRSRAPHRCRSRRQPAAKRSFCYLHPSFDSSRRSPKRRCC